MSLSLLSPHCNFFQVHNLFALKITYTKSATKINMALQIPIVNTKDITDTASILQMYLPSVLYSTCFNDDKLPFAVEVQATEIGHLFEHILLEYLCYFKLLTGEKSAEYSGVTKWNWEKDPWGVFNITINAGLDEFEIFAQAMQQTILLTQYILNEYNPNSLALPTQFLEGPSVQPVFDQLER